MSTPKFSIGQKVRIKKDTPTSALYGYGSNGAVGSTYIIDNVIADHTGIVYRFENSNYHQEVWLEPYMDKALIGGVLL